MSQSIRFNAEFRKLMMRARGATGRELQELTGRDYVYSTWSLRTMETPTHELWTMKEGNETRYGLWTKEQKQAYQDKLAANDAKKAAKLADAS